MCVLPSTLSAQLILAQSLRDCSPSQNEKSFSAAASFDYYSCKLRVVVLFLASSLPCASFIVVATTPQKREKKPCTTAEITFSMLIEKRRVLRCRKHCCSSHAITLHDEFFGGDRTFFRLDDSLPLSTFPVYCKNEWPLMCHFLQRFSSPVSTT